MKQGIYTITGHRTLVDGVRQLTLSGDTSALVRPGQFVNLLVQGCYLRRPISVADWDDHSLTLIYKVVGRGTAQLARMRPGARLDLLTGLGNGFDMGAAAAQTLLVGGGAGVPPLIGLARRLCAGEAPSRWATGAEHQPEHRTDGKGACRGEDGNPGNEPRPTDGVRGDNPCGTTVGKAPTAPRRHVTAVVGFNTAREVFGVEALEAAGARVVVATADGSRGIRGLVTDAIAADGADGGYFYACGPLLMLKALCEALPAPGQVSLEERMGCGFGACMGCTCHTAEGPRRICREGPVFSKEEILWNEILR